MTLNPLRGGRKDSGGPRWQTTMHAGYKELEEALIDEPMDVGARTQGLKDRKLANTTTSISFGNYHAPYISDAMHEQKKILNGANDPASRAAQADRVKDMKKALTKTSFRLGDEVPEYESTVHSAQRQTATAIKGHKKIAMNADLKAAIKKSSLHFGNESTEYRSVMTDAMAPHENMNDFKKTSDEVTQLKTQLRKHNFTLGDEPVQYTTDYNSGYGSVDLQHYRKGDERAEIQRQINEIRKCHFSLGQEKIDYKSDSHRCFENMTTRDPKEVAAILEQARDMKKQLQRTTIVIGDDGEYA